MEALPSLCISRLGLAHNSINKVPRPLRAIHGAFDTHVWDAKGRQRGAAQLQMREVGAGRGAVE